MMMADTAVDTTVLSEVSAKLKEKKEEEEKKAENGDSAPANRTNGVDHSDKVKEAAKDEQKNRDAEAVPPVEETDVHLEKRAAEEHEEKVDVKKQKKEENGDSKETDVVEA